MRYRLNPPPSSPAARIIAVLATIATLAMALFFGFIVLLIALGFMAAFGLYTWIRVRWGTRRGVGAAPTKERPEAGGRDIEADYEVVSRRRD